MDSTPKPTATPMLLLMAPPSRHDEPAVEIEIDVAATPEVKSSVALANAHVALLKSLAARPAPTPQSAPKKVFKASPKIEIVFDDVGAAKDAPQPILLSQKWLGNIDYISGVKAVDKEQAEFTALEALELPIRAHSVFGLEHPLTITLGKRADPLKDFNVSIRVLKEHNVQIVAVDRGGQATLHNLGQLVIYPHVHLPTWGVGVREFVEILQRATQKFLLDFGIQAIAREGEPGLFTEKGKIAFFGLRIKKGWSSHGLAINVCNVLEDFLLIRSCGIKNLPHARIIDYPGNQLTQADLPRLFKHWCKHFEGALRLTAAPDRPMLGGESNQSFISLRV